MLPLHPPSTLIPGPDGDLECAVETPEGQVRGVIVIAHPNPQQGGTMDNKVVHTLARAGVQSGWRSVRFNFRGVGRSRGSWDNGRGEVDDMLCVVDHAAVDGLPLVLAGFSFGGAIAVQAYNRGVGRVSPCPRLPLILVAPAVGRVDVGAVPAATLVVHGESDDVVPLGVVLDWARPQELPVVVLPGVGHFFHGQLPALKQLVSQRLELALL